MPPKNTKSNREALAQNMKTNTGSYIRYVESYVIPEKEPERFINEVLKNKIIPEIDAMLWEVPGPIEYRYKQLIILKL